MGAAQNRAQREDDEEQVSANRATNTAQALATTATNTATASQQIGANAQPPKVVGQHQAPVSIPGVTSPAPSGATNKKPQW